MIYELTSQERQELAVLLARIETGELGPRRVAVELLLARKVIGALRRLLPAQLDAYSRDVRAALDRMPLLSEAPAWKALSSEHYEQRNLIP